MEGEDEPKNDICGGGGICSPILSTSIHKSALYVFARTSNNTIAYRRYASDSTWEEWVNLGESTERAVQGGAKGQETASVFAYTRPVVIVSLLAVTLPPVVDGVVRWDGEHVEVVELVSDAPSDSPRLADERIKLFVTARDNGEITHSWWQQKDDSEVSQGARMSEQGAFTRSRGGEWRSKPEKASSAVYCISRDDGDESYDLAYCAEMNSRATVASWSQRRETWSYKDLQGGDWIGNPYLFSSLEHNERWDFFGLKSDNQLYHSSWTQDDFPAMKSLGGNIISQPTVVSIGSSSYEVVALGSNGTLQHLHLARGGRVEDWEDLGIEGRSAPSARLINNQVVLVAVAQNRSLMAWTQGTSTKARWKESLSSEDLGGI